MRPTVPELLNGVADALEQDAAGAITDPHAHRQVVAALGILRRVATLVPHLHPLLLADADDVVATLRALDAHLAPEHRARLEAASRDLDALDVRRATLVEVDAHHQRLLALLDDVVASPEADGPEVRAALDDVLARLVARERAIGASIAGR